ncbi:MAG: hypothetical protein U5N85_10120 [Arcicella sp.]|nr:hypothetical protein [Arcicella sp.]
MNSNDRWIITPPLSVSSQTRPVAGVLTSPHWRQQIGLRAYADVDW